MRIEIGNEGSEAYVREVVNTLMQTRNIQKKHNHKVQDLFKQCRSMLIVTAVLIVLLVALGIWLGFGPFMIVALTILAISALISVLMLFSMNRTLKALKAKEGTGALTLDEEGIELETDSGEVTRRSWNTVLLLHVGTELLAFVPAESTGTVFMVSRKYETEVLAWLSANRPELEIAC